MYKFNEKANKSHKIYGIRRLLESVLIFKNEKYVIIVNTSVPIKSKSANIGILNLKNIVVQDKLNSSCIKKKVNAEQYG